MTVPRMALNIGWKIIQNETPNSGLSKIFPLKKGIQSAHYEIILLTDADCQPASKDWIGLMTGALKDETEIVLGYSPFFQLNGLVNHFIRYENFLTSLYYLSFAITGMPYMGTGRNLSYRKSVTGTIGALEHQGGLMTGDDDITVNRIATNRNTALMIHPKSHVFTVSATTFGEFIHQKRRHFPAGFHYRPKHKVVLGALYSSQIIFNALFIPLVINGFLLIPTISIFIIKNILQTLLYGKAMRRLNVHNLWIFTPVFDLLVSAFFLTLGCLSFLKIKTWK